MTRSVIIAVSDPHIQYLLQRYAEECGFLAVQTRQNEEAVALARQVRPELIVFEVDSPGMAGHGVLRDLRADRSTCNIPVVAYISNAESGVTPPEGCQACLHQSLMYDDFVAAMRQVAEIAAHRSTGRGAE